MVSTCDYDGALLYVPSRSIRSWYDLGIFRLFRNVKADLVLAPVSTRWLTETNWKAMGNRDLLPYNHDDGKV